MYAFQISRRHLDPLGFIWGAKTAPQPPPHNEISKRKVNGLRDGPKMISDPSWINLGPSLGAILDEEYRKHVEQCATS